MDAQLEMIKRRRIDCRPFSCCAGFVSAACGSLSVSGEASCRICGHMSDYEMRSECTDFQLTTSAALSDNE